MIEDTLADDHAGRVHAPPPDPEMRQQPDPDDTQPEPDTHPHPDPEMRQQPEPDTRQQRHARYAAGQMIAAYHYRVPIESVVVDMQRDRGTVILWPVVYPTEDYLWGRVVLCVAGEEAVRSDADAERLPIEALPDSRWEYVPPRTRAPRSPDDVQVWQIIQTIHGASNARRNDLYRAARQQAYTLFLSEANRAALAVLVGHLRKRGEITGMEATAIVGGVLARTAQ
jgi:hypothetical protein